MPSPFDEPVVVGRPTGPMRWGLPLLQLTAEDDRALGSLTPVRFEIAQRAQIFELRDPDGALHAIFVRPQVRNGADWSKTLAVRDPRGAEIVTVYQRNRLFLTPRLLARASRGGQEVATMALRRFSDPKVYLDPSGVEVLRMTASPADGPARDASHRIEMPGPASDRQLLLSTALARLATMLAHTQAAAPKTGAGELVFGSGPATPGVAEIVADVLRIFG